MRNRVIALLVALGLGIVLSGCSVVSLNHAASSASSAAHSAENTLKKHHVLSSVLCVYHTDRFIHDLRTHHPGYSALQIAGAVNSCRYAFYHHHK